MEVFYTKWTEELKNKCNENLWTELVFILRKLWLSYKDISEIKSHNEWLKICDLISKIWTSAYLWLVTYYSIDYVLKLNSEKINKILSWWNPYWKTKL